MSDQIIEEAQEEPDDETLAAHKAALKEQEDLAKIGVAIVAEVPEYDQQQMTLMRHKIVGKKIGTDTEFEVWGDTRANAVSALVVAAKSR